MAFMGSYLKFYSFDCEIHVLHTAKSMFVFQEFDIKLTVHFTLKRKNNYCFVIASIM